MNEDREEMDLGLPNSRGEYTLLVRITPEAQRHLLTLQRDSGQPKKSLIDTMILVTDLEDILPTKAMERRAAIRKAMAEATE
jgi:hypothetical protein